MAHVKPVVFGLAGLGGYAAQICKVLERASDGHAEGAGPAPIRFVAACEPDQVKHAAVIQRLRDKGVKVLPDIDALLAEPIEALWLPLPIHLHRPFTEKSLAAGKAVMCEKPAAGSVDDVDAMIAARDRAGLPVAIGYQDTYDPSTLEAKRRLLQGDIGKLQSATLHCCWPRGSIYYNRSNWAGAFKRDGVWVMDSPANNAMAHYINLLLFLAGPALEQPAQPVAVEAELYRVNPIENYDTISLRVRVEGGVSFLVLMTHACAEMVDPTIRIHGEGGELHWQPQRIEMIRDGQTEAIPRSQEQHRHMIERFARLVRGEPDDRVAVATLEVARAPLVAVNGASEAAVIQDVPAPAVQVVATEKRGQVRTIPGIEDLFAQCAQRRQMLHESGLAPWTAPAGSKDLRGYRHFAGPRLSA